MLPPTHISCVQSKQKVPWSDLKMLRRWKQFTQSLQKRLQLLLCWQQNHIPACFQKIARRSWNRDTAWHRGILLGPLMFPLLCIFQKAFSNASLCFFSPAPLLQISNCFCYTRAWKSGPFWGCPSILVLKVILKWVGGWKAESALLVLKWYFIWNLSWNVTWVNEQSKNEWNLGFF